MRELQRSTAFRKWAWASTSSSVGCLFAMVLLWGGVLADENTTVGRKELAAEVNKEVTERIIGQICSKDDISVYQGATTPLPNGIPTFTVQILNMCISGGCTIADIHLSCGWFSSARTINPRVFRRLGYDDCLVNDGAPLGPGSSLFFQYANSYQYPLSVAFVRCY